MILVHNCIFYVIFSINQFNFLYSTYCVLVFKFGYCAYCVHLSRRYALLTSLDAKLIGFEHVKELHEHDSDFAQISIACKKGAFKNFIELTVTYLGKINYVYLNLLCESCF